MRPESDENGRDRAENGRGPGREADRPPSRRGAGDRPQPHGEHRHLAAAGKCDRAPEARRERERDDEQDEDERRTHGPVLPRGGNEQRHEQDSDERRGRAGERRLCSEGRGNPADASESGQESGQRAGRRLPQPGHGLGRLPREDRPPGRECRERRGDRERRPEPAF